MGEGSASAHKRARIQDSAHPVSPAASPCGAPCRPTMTRLAELTPSPGRVDLVALVRFILPQGKVTCRNGAMISLCLVKLADDSDPSGSVSLKLWRQRAEWVEQGKLQVGDVLLLIDAGW